MLQLREVWQSRSQTQQMATNSGRASPEPMPCKFAKPAVGLPMVGLEGEVQRFSR